MKMIIAACIVLLFVTAAFAASKREESKITRTISSLRPLINAIGEVETGGIPESKRDEAKGDNGLARGRYQIHANCAIDTGHSHMDAHDPETARRIMAMYWLMYCPDAVEKRDYERLARIWNGGPRGHTKPATVGYWLRVKARL